MLWKTIDKLFDFKKEFKKSLILSIIFYLIIFLILYLCIFLLFNLKVLLIEKQKFQVALINFITKWKITGVFFGCYTFLFIGIMVVVNWNDFKPEFKKDKNPNEIFLWNERKKIGNWKKLFSEFVEKPKNKANWILGYKIDAKTKKKIWIVNNKDNHAKIIGGTGSGKSQFLVLPNITYNAQLPESEKPCMFITDPKKEIYNTMNNYLSDNGYQIKLIDLIDEDGETWNPLMFAYEIINSKPFNELKEQDYSKAISSINEIVEDLGWPDGKNDIWLRSSKSILTSIFTYLLYKTMNNPLFKKYEIERLNPEDLTIIKAAEFLSPNNFKNGTWREEITKMSEHNIFWKQLLQIFSNLPQKADGTLEGMISNAQDVINGYATHFKLSDRLSSSSLNLKELLENMNEKPFALFICYPDHENAVNKFNTLFLKQLYKYATEEANKQKQKHLPRKFQFYLEEFASLATIDDFHKSISIARSRWIFFLIIIQSYAQLKKYDTGKGETTTIIDNTGLTYFISSSSVETMESFIKSIGKKEIISKSISHSDKNDNVSSSEQDKNILEINDLKEKPKNDVLIDIPNEKPFLWTMTPFYIGFKDILNDERKFEYQVSPALKAVREKKENKVIQRENLLKHVIENVAETTVEEKIMNNDFRSRNAQYLFGKDKMVLLHESFRDSKDQIFKEINFKLIEQFYKSNKHKSKG